MNRLLTVECEAVYMQIMNRLLTVECGAVGLHANNE